MTDGKQTKSLNDLAAILNEMYHGAKEGEATTMIHLFGVRYADRLRELGRSTKDVAVAAGINESYGNEIGKGMRLARYVTVNDAVAP